MIESIRTSREQKLAVARRRMANLAIELQEQFRPIEVAQLLLGAGSGVLANAHGRETAALYLAELADCV